MRPVIVLLLAVPLAACGGGGAAPKPKPKPEAVARTCTATYGDPEEVSSAPASTPSRARMGPGMTLTRTPKTLAAGRGKPLVVTGRVTGDDCEPLAGATLNAWQANARGIYGPGRDGSDRCCYLTATVRTDADGRYAFDTIMPRGYAGGEAHIHVEAGHPDAEGVVAEILFPDGPVRRTTFDIVLARR
jgi:protocatechuate 3,4-dioxygenase beta subunit